MTQESKQLLKLAGEEYKADKKRIESEMLCLDRRIEALEARHAAHMEVIEWLSEKQSPS